MKELNIAQKAQAYDKALNKAIELYSRFEGRKQGDILEDVFPELKESEESEEDEKIRKEIIDFVKSRGGFKGDWIAWLEKQGEQKPADLKIKAGNWYICDEEVMNENMVAAFHPNEIYYCPKDGYLDVDGALFEVGHLDVFRLATEKEIPQSKQEWSEEDEMMIKFALTYFRKAGATEDSDIIKWLKSLRPQLTWKPSLAQLNALSIVSKGCAPDDIEAIVSLYQELKKLKEE